MGPPPENVATPTREPSRPSALPSRLEELEQRPQVLGAFGVLALRIAQPVIEGHGRESGSGEESRERRVRRPVLGVLGAARLEHDDRRASPLPVRRRQIDVGQKLRAAHLLVHDVAAHPDAVHAGHGHHDRAGGIGLRGGGRGDESEREAGESVHGVPPATDCRTGGGQSFEGDLERDEPERAAAVAEERLALGFERRPGILREAKEALELAPGLAAARGIREVGRLERDRPETRDGLPLPRLESAETRRRETAVLALGVHRREDRLEGRALAVVRSPSMPPRRRRAIPIPAPARARGAAQRGRRRRRRSRA